MARPGYFSPPSVDQGDNGSLQGSLTLGRDSWFAVYGLLCGHRARLCEAGAPTPNGVYQAIEGIEQLICAIGRTEGRHAP